MLWAFISFFIAGIAFILISIEEQSQNKPSKTLPIVNEFLETIEKSMDYLHDIHDKTIQITDIPNIIMQLKDLRKSTRISRRLILQNIRNARTAYKEKRTNITPQISGAGTIGIIANVYRAVDLNNLDDFKQMEIEPLIIAKDRVDDLILEIDLTLCALDRILINRRSKAGRIDTYDQALINVAQLIASHEKPASE